MTTGPLSSRLAQVCDRLDDPAVVPVRERLTDPRLRIAVAGRLNAGKSTLVNALLRHPVAPVAAGECTKVTTWFRYGTHEGAVAEMLDGTRVEIALGADRRLPADLPMDVAMVRRLVVDLSNESLRSMTMVDTPGLDTTTEGVAERTAGVLGMGADDVAGEVDAVVYVMPHARASDLDRLDLLRSRLGADASPLTTIGVLTKTDRLATADPLATGAAMAADLARDLRGILADVVPVAGLLGETAEADGLTEGDADALRAVAGLDPRRRLLALSSAARFTALELPDVTPDRLDRLLGRLDMFGLRRLVGEVGAATSAVEMSTQVRAWSGIDVLRTSLQRAFAARADMLRAHSAVLVLRALAWGADLDADRRGLLLDEIDAVEAAAEYHPWHEARVLADFTDSDGTGDGGLDQEAIRVLTATTWQERLGLAGSADAGQAADLALAGYRRWTEVLNSPQTRLTMRRAGEVVRRSYLLCYRDLETR